MYKQNGKTFSFMEIKLSKEQQSARNSFQRTDKSQKKPIKNHTKNNSAQNQIPMISFPSFLNQLNHSFKHIKQITIHFVQSLRRHSLEKHIQLQIQDYLTKVLDQIDFITQMQIQNPKQEFNEKTNSNNYLSQSRQFLQIDKPKGDDQLYHIQQTMRNTLTHPMQFIKNQSKDNLNDKLQSILREIEIENSNVQNIKQDQLTFKQRLQLKVGLENTPSLSQFQVSSESKLKNESKAHKFSSLYIRDSNKHKKMKFY